MEQKQMTRSKEITILTVAGGLGFWVANFAISLTPIAAEYRAALSISYFPMLLEALIGGLVIGFCVSYFLLRFFDKLPCGAQEAQSRRQITVASDRRCAPVGRL